MPSALRVALPELCTVLPWALVDRRALKVTQERDVMWLRVLDVVQALEARGWDAEGEIVLGVREQQGLDSQLQGALLIFDEWVTVAIGAQDAEGNQIVGGIAVQAAADAAIAVHDVIRR